MTKHFVIFFYYINPCNTKSKFFLMYGTQLSCSCVPLTKKHISNAFVCCLQCSFFIWKETVRFIGNSKCDRCTFLSSLSVFLKIKITSCACLTPVFICIGIYYSIEYVLASWPVSKINTQICSLFFATPHQLSESYQCHTIKSIAF